MDFLDPKKTRQHTIRLFTGYVLVAIMILLATATLVYYAYGYNVNRKGELVQRGLVFVSSQPSGADLLLDGKPTDTTNTKLNLAAGRYQMTLKRDGYRDWSRNITVDGGDVSHYVYPLLLPSRLQTDEVKTFEVAPALTTQSPDRRWLVALTDVNTGSFEVFDLNRDRDQVADSTAFEVPAELMSASTAPVRWEVLEWATNNRHMLLKRYFTADNQEQFEYILADRQRPEGSYNLSRELGVTPTELVLHDKKPTQYYLYDAANKTISTADLDNLEPQVKIKDVLAYKVYGADTVLYVSDKDAAAGKVAIKLRQNSKDYTLRNITASEHYMLDVARYEGDWYIVLGSQAENRIFIYKNPVEQIKETKKAGVLYALRLAKPTAVSFSANAQFVLAQNGEMFHLYDLENLRSHRYKVHYPIDQPQPKALWADDSRLTYVSSGKQVVFDYDNINRRELVDASPTFLSAHDQDNRYLYTFTAGQNGGLKLSSTALRISSDL